MGSVAALKYKETNWWRDVKGKFAVCLGCHFDGNIVEDPHVLKDHLLVRFRMCSWLDRMRVIIHPPQCHVEYRSIDNASQCQTMIDKLLLGPATPIDEQPNSVALLSQFGNYGDSCSMAFFWQYQWWIRFFLPVEGGNMGLFENSVRITGWLSTSPWQVLFWESTISGTFTYHMDSHGWL